MNQKLITLLAAAAVSPFVANAEIELAEGLSVGGYIDLTAGDDNTSGDNSSSQVAEFELDFNYTSGDYFATTELSFTGMESDLDVAFETVVVGWNITEELSVSAGNILSYLGWETYDSTGLYQISYAYGAINSAKTFVSGINLTDVNTVLVDAGFAPITQAELDDVVGFINDQGGNIPGYAVGASIDYVTDQFSVGVWVGDSADYDISYEVAAKYYGVEGLTLFVAYADDPGYETFNTWASYEVDAFTFALEYVDHEKFFSGMSFYESDAYLAMVNYAADNYGVTLRYSMDDAEVLGAVSYEVEKITISPSYTFSDNLMGLVEFSWVDDELNPALDYEWGVELLYTF